jgi:hypothetical protein
MASLNGEAVHFERKALTITIVLGAPDPPVSDQTQYYSSDFPLVRHSRFRGAQASRPLVLASRQNNLEKSLRTRDGFARARDGRAPPRV